jgi:hypothetical protein
VGQGWGRGLGRQVLRHRYSLLRHHLAVPCDKVRLLSSSHGQDFSECARVGRRWGGGGAMVREGLKWSVRAPTGPCWHGGRRQHGLARARLHFESGLWPLHPSAPMYAAEGTEGEGEGQASWGMPAGAWSCVAGGRAAGRAASAQLRPGEDEDGVAPCDRLRRAVVGAGRLSVQHDEERGSAPKLCWALAWWGCRPAQTQSSTGQSAAGRRPAARDMS